MDQGSQGTLTDLFLKGAPVRWVFPAPTPAAVTVHSISAKAPHPNAGRLLQEWSVAIGLLLTVLVLVPIGFMFLGSVLSGGLVEPSTHLTLEKLGAVYASLPYMLTVASTLVISLLVGAVATIVGVMLACLVARTDLPAKGAM